MKIKKKEKLTKTQKELKKFKKLVKSMLSHNISFIIENDILYAEYKKKFMKEKMPNEWQIDVVKNYTIAIQENRDIEFVNSLLNNENN